RPAGGRGGPDRGGWRAQPGPGARGGGGGRLPGGGARDRGGGPPADTERLLTGALRGDRARVGPVLEFMAGLRDGGGELRQSAAAEPLNECVQRLGAMGLGPFVAVDFTIVRGLAYHTGIVFERFD